MFLNKNMGQKRWLPEEINMLQELAGTDEIDSVITAFKSIASKHNWPPKTSTAIRIKMKRLGLSYRPTYGGWNCTTLAAALGCDRDRVHDWITRGLLKSSRNKEKRHHQITLNNFQEFAKQYPEWLTEIDLFNLETVLGKAIAERIRSTPKMTRGKKMAVQNTVTGIIYPSLRAAARQEFFEKSTIKECAETGRKTRCGRSFEFVT
jgi:hypothetical protein